MKHRTAATEIAHAGRNDWLNFLLVWLCAWAAIAITHIGLLRLPYYWDEAGYYIPAAYDFFRFHTLVPITTLSNAHPPLPSIFLAACWKLFEFHPLVTRLAVTAIAALGLVAVYRIARLLLPVPSGAFAVAALTLLYPVWFAQSTLAHADIFAAAATLWALALFIQNTPRIWPAGICFAIAALSKETAVITPLVLLLWLGWKAVRGEQRTSKGADSAGNFTAGARAPTENEQITARLKPCPSENMSFSALTSLRSEFAALLLAPVLLACWYAYHWHHTGFIFGNPEYLRYNATGTLHVTRVLYSAWLRAWHVTGHMNLWVAALLSLAFWLLPARREIGGTSNVVRARQILVLVFVANLVVFSILGGAILTRYLLPLYPLVILFHVGFWQSRTRWWPLATFVTGIAFFAGLFFDPPYQFAAEDNLSYVSAIRVEQQAIHRILASNASPTVLTAWPVSDYLTKPELGYVTAPVHVIAVKDFSLQQMMLARQQPFDSALLFYQLDPPPRTAHFFLRPGSKELVPRADVPPAFAARFLGGQIAWQTLERRHYAAVVQINGPVDAQAAPALPGLPRKQTFIMAAR